MTATGAGMLVHRREPHARFGTALDASRPEGEALLAAVAQRRDRGAFAQLFAWFAPRVKGQLMAAGLDAARAEDLTQDVMLTVWRKAGLYDPSRGAASTWVYAITRNQFLNSIRRKSTPEPDHFADAANGGTPATTAGDFVTGGVTLGGSTTAGDAGCAAEHLVIQAERERLLGKALAELPVEQRDALRGAYFSGQSLRQVADGQSVPLGTLKTRIRLALEKLRSTMKGRQA